MGNLDDLMQEFPNQFYSKDGKCYTPCPSEYPKGWHDLIRGVMKRVDGARVDLKWAQIKEKYGELRMYEDLAAEQHDHSCHEWISEAERLSKTACIECGAKATCGNRCWCRKCFAKRSAN